MHKIKNKIVRAWEEHPVEMTMAAAALLYATSKVVQSVADARGSHAYARQVNYRIKHNK